MQLAIGILIRGIHIINILVLTGGKLDERQKINKKKLGKFTHQPRAKGFSLVKSVQRYALIPY